MIKWILLSLFIALPVYAEGTYTASQVKTMDIEKRYLDISNIQVTEKLEGDKSIVCLNIDNTYEITDVGEMIKILIDIIKNLNATVVKQ